LFAKIKEGKGIRIWNNAAIEERLNESKKQKRKFIFCTEGKEKLNG
jgi:hypothetical protein